MLFNEDGASSLDGISLDIIDWSVRQLNVLANHVLVNQEEAYFVPNELQGKVMKRKSEFDLTYFS